ncbi:MAG: hypothetical protein H0T78_08005 [Longispora sp.]|nr:hypothetical protein [Longispora sp. (in: high G+C Gram-positive bacteria)]
MQEQAEEEYRSFMGRALRNTDPDQAADYTELLSQKEKIVEEFAQKYLDAVWAKQNATTAWIQAQREALEITGDPDA